MNSKGLNISYFLFNKSISRALSEPVLYPGLEMVSCLALDLEAAAEAQGREQGLAQEEVGSCPGEAVSTGQEGLHERVGGQTCAKDVFSQWFARSGSGI